MVSMLIFESGPPKEQLTLNPSVPHPGLFPTVISVNPALPVEYRKGFKKPSGGRLLDSRTSFNKLTNPAKVGEDAEVPPINPGWP